MKRSANFILSSALALVLIAVAAIVFVSIRQTQKVKDTAFMVAHTHDVLFQTERLLTLIVDNVRLTRGFLLTGNKSMKDGVKKNKQEIREQFAKLRSKLSFDKIQLAQTDSLGLLLNRRIDFSDDNISKSESGARDEAIKAVASGKGAYYLEQIRQMIAYMQNKERDLLEQRRSANEAAVKGLNNILVLILSTVFLLILLLLSRYKTDRELQKKAERQNQYLAALVNQVTDAIISTNRHMEIVSWNRGAELLYGWNGVEVMGKNLADVLQGEFTSGTRDNLLYNLEEYGFWQGESNHRRKTGEPFEVWVSSSRLVDNEGEMAGTVTVTRDISEKKKVEKKLHAYNEQLEKEVQNKTAEIKEVFERVADGFLALNTEFNFIYLNGKAAEMLDLHPENILGKKLWNVFPGAMEKGYPKLFEQIMQCQKPVQREEYAPLLDKWFDMRIYPSPKGITVFIRDITHRKQAQQALLESEEKYQMLVEQASDGIFVADPDGNCIHANASACEITGCDVNELIKLNILDLIPSGRQGEEPVRLDALREGMTRVLEHKIRRKDGTLIDVEISAKRLTDGRLQAIVRNISESKKAKEKLEESEAKFKSLVEQALVGVYIIQDGRFVYVNPQMAAIHGYTREELLAFHSVLDLVVEEQRQIVADNLRVRINGEAWSMNYEFSIRRKNNELAVIEVFGNRTLFKGRPAIIGTAIDNTERKKAERAIRQSNDRFKLLSRATNDAMWDWDLVSNKIWWNEKHYQLYGLNPDQVPLQYDSWYERIHPEDRLRVVEDLNKTIEACKPVWEKEYRFLMPNEKYGHLYDRVYIEYEGKKPVRMLGSVMDITLRIEAEELLRDSEQKYKLLFDNNPLPMSMLSVRGSRFIDVNSAAIRQYGYSREEFLELNIDSIRAKEETSRLPDQSDQTRSGINYSGTWKHKKKNGEIIDVDIISHEIMYRGELVLLVLSIDVTEKVRYEQQIKDTNEQLRQLSAHLQDIREEERLNMAREIHDELGQQLTVLKMDVSWLNKRLNNENVTIRQKVTDILSLLDRTVKSVRRIATELRPSILDDLGLIAAMEWQADEFSQKSGIPIQMNIHSIDLEIPPAASINLFRIFQESLTNIARHAQAGKVLVSFEQKENHIILTVADDGRGFDDNLISRKRTLGILGMKERAIMTGGQYSITSKPGGGTRVEVLIPSSALQQTKN